MIETKSLLLALHHQAGVKLNDFCQGIKRYALIMAVDHSKVLIAQLRRRKAVDALTDPAVMS